MSHGARLALLRRDLHFRYRRPVQAVRAVLGEAVGEHAFDCAGGDAAAPPVGGDPVAE